jgi:hypothetical protein
MIRIKELTLMNIELLENSKYLNTSRIRLKLDYKLTLLD